MEKVKDFFFFLLIFKYVYFALFVFFLSDEMILMF